MKKLINGVLLLTLLITLGACNNDDEGGGGGSLLTNLLFPVSKDIELGKQLRDEIASNPTEYPIVSRAEAPKAYAYIEAMRDYILASDDIRYKDEFAWEI